MLYPATCQVERENSQRSASPSASRESLVTCEAQVSKRYSIIFLMSSSLDGIGKGHMDEAGGWRLCGVYGNGSCAPETRHS